MADSIVYHIKVMKGRKERMYPPCIGYTVTAKPEGSDGLYNEHPEIVGLPPEGFYSDNRPNHNQTPEGQILKFELDNPTHDVIYLPRDGKILFVMNGDGDTIDTYPRKAQRNDRS